MDSRAGTTDMDRMAQQIDDPQAAQTAKTDARTSNGTAGGTGVSAGLAAGEAAGQAAGQATGQADSAQGPALEQTLRTAMAQATLIFGQVVSIFLQSPRHRHLLLADLEWRVIPAIALRQYRLVQHKGMREGMPGGFVSWALVSEEVEAQLQQPDFRLRPQDWKSGERVWIVDVVGPPQAAAALIEKLKEDLFAGREVKVRPGALPAADTVSASEGLADGKMQGKLMATV